MFNVDIHESEPPIERIDLCSITVPIVNYYMSARGIARFDEFF